MLCDSGCRTPLGDIVPTTVRVIDEPLAARALRQIERYRAHFDSKLLRIDGLARRSMSRTLGTEKDIAEMTARVSALTDRLDGLGDRPVSFPWAPVASAAAVGALLACAAMLVLKARRAVIVRGPASETATAAVPVDPRELAEQTKEPAGIS